MGLSGSDWMTTNIPEWHFTYQKNFLNWHSVKHTITNLEGTMQPWKCTSGSHHHTSGPKYTQMYLNTPKHVSDVNKEKNQQPSHWYFSHWQYRTNQISGFMLTFLAQCSPPDINTNTSFASPTLSQSTCWSQPSQTKKQKPSQRPFFQMVLKIWHPNANSHWWREGVC